MKTFFFLETTCFWVEKTFEFLILAEKSVSISVKIFFFFGDHLFLGGINVWISEVSKKFWFKNNENLGQACLHFSHSSKKAPPLFQILATRLDTYPSSNKKLIACSVKSIYAEILTLSCSIITPAFGVIEVHYWGKGWTALHCQFACIKKNWNIRNLCSMN